MTDIPSAGPAVTGQVAGQVAEPSGLTAGVFRTRLSNGLTVLIKENHQVPVAALLIHVNSGYFQETDAENGISHVVEHMIFKGTPKRPNDEQFAKEVRELGGVLNASTYYEETSYYVVVPSSKFEQALELQTDALQNASLDGKELAKEIEVIVQESLQKRDNPNAMLVESMYELAFDSHRIRRWRMGLPETLRGFTHDDLKAFVVNNYRPQNMVVTVVGDIDTAQTLALIERYWENLAPGDFRRQLSPIEAEPKSFRYKRMTGETRQRLVIFALPAPPILAPDAPALMVLSAILSDGRSSRLYRRLKEDLRLANSAWSSYDAFEQMGLFTFGAEAADEDPIAVEQALWAELAQLKYERVGEEEIRRILTRLESRRLFAQEDVLGVARTLANYEALGDYHLSDVLVARLRDVTAADIQRVAREYLRVERSTLLEYLPLEAPDAVSPRPQRSQNEVLTALQSARHYREASLSPNSAQGAENKRWSVARDLNVLFSEPVKFRLPGGPTVVYQRRSDLPIVSLNLLFRGGKRLENASLCGITNLMLKSSLKGAGKRNAEEISNQIESLGTGVSLSAAADYFGYGIKLHRRVLEEGLEILGDVIFHPTFPAEEVDREKQAIFAEIRRQQDSNSAVAFDLFSAACYGEHPYGLPANGIAEAVEAVNTDGLTSWHRRHIRPENLYVGVVGDLSREEAANLIARMIPQIEGGGEEIDPFTPIVLGNQPFQEKAVQRKKKQTAVVIGFEGANLNNPDRYALEVLGEIVSGMGGRFFRIVRGENALAYHVAGFHRSRLDSGNFVAYTSTTPENEVKARDLLLQECTNLGAEGVTNHELEIARASILGEHVIGTQGFGAQSGELAVACLYGLPADEPKRNLENLVAVTKDQIQAVAEQYLLAGRCWLGVARGE